MKKTDEIIQKVRIFNQYMESIDVEALEKQCSYAELEDLQQYVGADGLQNFSMALTGILERKQKEETIRKTVIQHYPILTEIDFLTEKEIVALDRLLGMSKVGNLVATLWQAVHDIPKRKRLEEWLEEKGVLQKRYAALCPKCGNENISKYVDEEEKNKLEHYLASYKVAYSDEAYNFLESALDTGCFKCDNYIEYEHIEAIQFKVNYLLVTEGWSPRST